MNCHFTIPSQYFFMDLNIRKPFLDTILMLVHPASITVTTVLINIAQYIYILYVIQIPQVLQPRHDSHNIVFNLTSG